MPSFQFTVRTADLVEESGIVTTESFGDALTAVTEHYSASEGTTLEIGVRGFPPARYECVLSMGSGHASWRPSGLLAA
ncbi:MAG: hypothetical protein ACREON_12175 [Gemmatimonadaceae bacterium]